MLKNNQTFRKRKENVAVYHDAKLLEWLLLELSVLFCTLAVVSPLPDVLKRSETNENFSYRAGIRDVFMFIIHLNHATVLKQLSN